MLVLTLLVFVFVFSVGKLLCPALPFTVSLHCGLAGFFVFYCPFRIHPETEWSPVFLVAPFPGSAEANVFYEG